MSARRTGPSARRKKASVLIVGAQAERLAVLARRWNVSCDEALRRTLDQALIGRGALHVAEAGFIFLEHLMTKPKPSLPTAPDKPGDKK
jgi:hypothetical protein